MSPEEHVWLRHVALAMTSPALAGKDGIPALTDLADELRRLPMASVLATWGAEDDIDYTILTAALGLTAAAMQVDWLAVLGRIFLDPVSRITALQRIPRFGSHLTPWAGIRAESLHLLWATAEDDHVMGVYL